MSLERGEGPDLQFIDRDLSRSNRRREGYENDLTESARDVLRIAANRARLSGRNKFEIRDLLTGILSTHDSVAKSVLEKNGFTLGKIEEMFPFQTEPNGHREILSEKEAVPDHFASQALELAALEKGDYDYVGTHHILLGIITSGYSPAVSLLTRITPPEGFRKLISSVVHDITNVS
jgi:ATP-dependent Clp protease ATP-binding subunit ClpA